MLAKFYIYSRIIEISITLLESLYVVTFVSFSHTAENIFLIYSLVGSKKVYRKNESLEVIYRYYFIYVHICSSYKNFKIYSVL